ncbi:MAG: DUF6544 family protein [Chryseolinea sp.]
MIYLIFVPIFIIVIVLAGRLNLNHQFSKEVKELFSQSGKISDHAFRLQKIADLPEPVKKYFQLVLKDGQSYISYARIKHMGQFKTGIDKSWINIKGEQYATTEKPGFIWKGTTSTFVARDMYISDKGRLVVSLLSLFNVVNAKGEQYNQGELLRWLGESVLYPTNFLPGERLHWSPIDSQSAKLTYNYKGLLLFFKITFNEIGEIVEMETKRYMDEKNLETWVIKASTYKQFNDVMIPTAFDVMWRLKKGDFCYAKFIITEVEYNKSEKF